MNNSHENLAIVGIGTDIVDVERIASLIEKYGDTFLKKTFTDSEIDACKNRADSAQKFAARFAAKEAMAKALGTGFRDDITLKSLSIKNDELGAPIAVLDSNAQNALEKLGAKKILVSLTHIKNLAQAFAIATK